jgi:hypothetical protein
MRLARRFCPAARSWPWVRVRVWVRNGLLAWGFTAQLLAAELKFALDEFPLNETPPGFRSALSGEGRPGEWRMVLDEIPSAFSSVTPKAPAVTKRQVLAQLSRDITDERFPLLIYEKETFGDFTLTTRLKMVSGIKEQMAGVVFRYQDEKNYYYVRASSLGNTFRFFKVVNGQRSSPIGPEMEIPGDTWHELTVECQGNQIRCLFNGEEVLPTITDTSFTSGKIGFWTKSDSVSYFSDTHIHYTPREPFIQSVIREMLRKYPRLLGLRVYALQTGKPRPVTIASSRDEELGQEGSHVESGVILRDSIYYGKTRQGVTVTLPLHDRNGDTVAAVRVTMRSFRGQTEQNAIARAMPIVKEMESRLRGAKGLYE